MIGVANCFNVERRKFKASGGGEGGRRADCTFHLEAAARGGEPNAPVKTTEMIESAGNTLEIEGGSWSYYLRTAGELVQCAFDAGPPCSLNQLYVRSPDQRHRLLLRFELDD